MNLWKQGFNCNPTLCVDSVHFRYYTVYIAIVTMQFQNKKKTYYNTNWIKNEKKHQNKQKNTIIPTQICPEMKKPKKLDQIWCFLVC